MKKFITSTFFTLATLVAVALVPKAAFAEPISIDMSIETIAGSDGIKTCGVDRVQDLAVCCSVDTFNLKVVYVFQGVDHGRMSVSYKAVASCTPKEEAQVSMVE